jgi:hypothetical protein
MSSKAPHHRFAYDWKKGGTYGIRKANPPPIWVILAACLVLALLVFLGWLSGASPVNA